MEYSHDNPEFPDTYPTDMFQQTNPNCRADAWVDRDDYLDYPKIVFENIQDFAEAIHFEQETISQHFPNGARLYHSVTQEGVNSTVVSYYWKGNDLWTHRPFNETMQTLGFDELVSKLRIE